MASIAMTGQDEDSQTASIDVTGQEESTLLDTTTIQGAEESTAATPGGSAATAATSGDITVAAAFLSTYMVVYAAQTQHKAIHIMGGAAELVQGQKG